MAKKAWLNPRRKKLVKPHLVTTKSGRVKMVDSYLHDYPHKDKELKKDKNKKEEKDTLSPNKKKQKDDVKKAEKELACKMNI